MSSEAMQVEDLSPEREEERILSIVNERREDGVSSLAVSTILRTPHKHVAHVMDSLRKDGRLQHRLMKGYGYYFPNETKAEAKTEAPVVVAVPQPVPDGAKRPMIKLPAIEITDPLACQLCAKDGREFIGRTAQGLAVHMARKHKVLSDDPMAVRSRDYIKRHAEQDTPPPAPGEGRRPCPVEGCGKLLRPSDGAIRHHLAACHAGLSIKEHSDIAHAWKQGLEASVPECDDDSCTIGPYMPTFGGLAATLAKDNPESPHYEVPAPAPEPRELPLGPNVYEPVTVTELTIHATERPEAPVDRAHAVSEVLRRAQGELEALGTSVRWHVRHGSDDVFDAHLTVHAGVSSC